LVCCAEICEVWNYFVVENERAIRTAAAYMT